MVIFRTALALLAGVLLLVLALHPHVALAQVTPDPAPVTALTVQQWIVIMLALAGAFGVFMTAVGQTLKLLGQKYPRLEVLAEDFLAWGADVQKAVSLVQNRTAAKRARLAAANAFPSVPPPANDADPPVVPFGRNRGFATREVMGGLGLAGLLFLVACTWLQSHPTVVTDTKACLQCVGADALKNETAAVPLPFYPQFCTELLNDCGGTCGTDIVQVISALAGSADPAVQKTGAFQEARARKAKMLAPSPVSGR